MCEECIRSLESKVQQEEISIKHAQTLGQRMDQAQARFRRAVESGENDGSTADGSGDIRASTAGGGTGPNDIEGDCGAPSAAVTFN